MAQGFKNFGSTCFENVVLNLFRHVHAFRSRFELESVKAAGSDGIFVADQVIEFGRGIRGVESKNLALCVRNCM